MNIPRCRIAASIAGHIQIEIGLEEGHERDDLGELQIGDNIGILRGARKTPGRGCD
ncbi:MAG: hypothetical protein ACR2M0_04615 [Chloroflexia bacterium]